MDWKPVAHICNPGHLGGRGQDVTIQSQPRQIAQGTLSQKKTSQKRDGGVAQGVGSESKPQYRPKEKKKDKIYKVNLKTL
jgi:hypothetical protein